VGKIENPHDPECQRKTYSQQGINAAQEKAADENLNHFFIAFKLCSLFSLEKPGPPPKCGIFDGIDQKEKIEKRKEETTDKNK